MRYCEAKTGRVFVIRLEHGEILHESVETFAKEHGVIRAALIILGGADGGSRLVVGPARGAELPPEPMETRLEEVHEISGVGTIFPNADGEPVLHMHIACGRGDDSVTGCVRRGVKVWHVMEVVMTELTDCGAVRAPDAATGFELLAPCPIR